MSDQHQNHVFGATQSQKAVDHGWLRLPAINIHVAHCVVQMGDEQFQEKVLAGVAQILDGQSGLHAQGAKIMYQISDFAARTQANVDKLQGDLTAIAAFIQTLQTSPGPISAEDQATLDALEQRVATVTGNADKLVPPVTPPTP